MSVIFQLFRADDLKLLSKDELDTLKKEINDALKVAQQVFQSHATTPKEPTQQKPLSEETPAEPLRLNIINKTDPSPNIPQSIKKVLDRALDERFYEVSQQLKSTQLRSASDFNGRLSQVHLNQPDLEEQMKEKTILEWAMSCEVNNFEFYYPLWYAKTVAYNFFYEKTGQEPKGPDSPYSPFNPGHPYSNFFYRLR